VPDEPANEPVVVARTAPHPWIVSPVFDFFFVFGGLVLIMLAVQLIFFGWSPPVPVTNALYPNLPGTVNLAVSKWLVIGGLLGSHLFSDSHTAATYMRIYATPESRSRFKIYAFYLPYVSVLLFLWSLNMPYVAGVCVIFT
jgi:hypothetical protein